MTPDQLLKKYPFIAATHQTSNASYVLQLCKDAHEQGQPQTVTYCKWGTEWATIKEYRNERYIHMFNQICKKQGFDFEVNCKELKYDLFFKNAVSETVVNESLQVKISYIIDKLKKRFTYGSPLFHSNFYELLSLDCNLETLDIIKNQSWDWKY